jgi:hypothetical protein
MENKPIYKVEPLDISVYFFRFIFLGVIFLCIINFNLNNIAFSIFIGVSILFILLSSTSYLFVYNDRFEILQKRIIKPLSSKYIHKYDEISSIEYSRSLFNPLNLVYYMPGTNKPKEYRITYLAENKEEYIRIIGSKKQALETIEIINKEIKKYQYNNGKHKI